MARIVIVGGPRRGKSTLALAFRKSGIPTFCGDPMSKVKEPEPDVCYLPEDIPFSGDDGAAAWIAGHWFTMPGPWVCEGHVMARALRRWHATMAPHGHEYPVPRPCDRIIVLMGPAVCEATNGQDAMHLGVMTVWGKIRHLFESVPGLVVEYR